MLQAATAAGAPASADVRERVARHTTAKIAAVVGGFLVVALAMGVATSVGTATLGPLDVFRSLAARAFPFLSTGLDALDEDILWQLRLPRIVMAALAGWGLAVSGAVMQAVLRNPLASPFTLGISSAAAFGASLAMVLGVRLGGAGSYIVIASAFACAVSCTALVYGISWWRGMSPETIVLAGIALSYLFGALTAVLQFMANEQQLQNLVNWTFGTFSGSTWGQIGIVAAILVAAMPAVMRMTWPMNAMASAGDDVARSLGVQPVRVRLVAGALCVLITASIISFTGIIGFVGLVGPHLARPFVGGDHRFLVPLAGLIGAVLLIASDTVGRTLMAPAVIPVGIVVSVIGVPLFVHMILTRRKEYFQ